MTLPTCWIAKPEKRLPKAPRPLVRTPLERSSKPPRKRNYKKWKRNQVRAYGPTERRQWVKDQPCCVSGRRAPSENVHIKSGGTSRKADHEFVIPLHWTLHRELHQWGAESFSAFYGVELDELAHATHLKWLATLEAGA